MEINAMKHTKTPTFYTKETKPQKSALHEEALPIFQRPRGTTRKRIEYSSNKDSSSGKQDEDDHGCGDDAGDDDEKVEVKRKIVALQRIVPGGEDLGADQLFEETAEYILALQCQIRTMKALASFIEGVDKEKRKLGG
ncbi:hypothetical protein HRI_000382900 [Hibiscus trionum]|uniref:Uncharacterized protein n=1 Tax=Hibiscus trionum TaxID=183268 RepID=A0A9W7H003_HIBTR|nr:hypothetical protein HRI_000382900 [Hibiscus trionum]